MTFEVALARCIEALEHDESVEACLAAWPDYADQLEPLLRIVGHLHRSRQIDASPAALANRREFEAILAPIVEAVAEGQSIESILASHPQYAVRLEPLLRVVERSHSIHKPQTQSALVTQTLTQISTQTSDIVLPSTLVPVRKPQALPVAGGPLPRTATAPQMRGFYWPRLAMVSVAASFILVASMFFNASAQSLPGDLLYPLKRGGEEVLGAATYIFGEPINWHVAQVQQRLDELAMMEKSGRQADPALVAQVNAEVRVEAGKALAQAATMPDAQSGPILANWLIWIQELQSNTDQSSPAAAALAEPLATVQSVLVNQPSVIQLMPIAAQVGTETPIEGGTPLPSQLPNPLVQSANLIPPHLEESTFTPPTTTSTPRQTTVTATLPSAGTATAASTPAEGEIEIVAVPIMTATPTPQSGAPVLASPVTFTPTLPSDGNAIATPSTTSSMTSVPALLPTVTNTTRVTPASATPTPPLPQSTPTPTEKPQSVMPTLTPISQPLPIVSLTPEPTKTPSPTASLTPKVSDTPLPAATFTPYSTDTPLPTDTPTPEPTDTASPTNTFTTEPTDTPLPTDTPTSVPTDTPLPTDTPTSVPTDTFTPEPTATSTPEPTDTASPTDTFTPQPTDTPEPTATSTPEPTDTASPTDTFMPEPTDTPLPTDTPTLEPTDTALPTDTPTDTPLPAETP